MKQLQVIWSGFAETELDKIFIYYCENASVQIAQSLVYGLISESERLSRNPEIGQLEELLYGRNKDFRYLIHKNYKLIYYVDIEFQQVRVVDVFDSRQNPKKLTRKK